MSSMILYVLAAFGVVTLLFIIVAIVIALQTPIRAKRDDRPPK